jgi:phytoene synthase
MTGTDAARLDAAYRYCRRLNARHGKTFFLATALLPATKRRYVHALYGFARYADDIVDHPREGHGRTASARLAELRTDVEASFAGADGHHPVVLAMADTVRRFDVDHRYLTDFFDSMQMDLTVTSYATFEDLARYMWGSASVVGLQLLPILGVPGERKIAEPYASDLGIAFQLTNFIRDIGEDFRRGRIYLPQDSLSGHGVSLSMFAQRKATPALKSLLAYEIDRARTYYRRAEPGIELLSTGSRDCIRTALVLYGEILTEIERIDYEVLDHRASVSLVKRARVASLGYLRSFRAQRSG